MLGAHEIRHRGLVTPLLEKYQHMLTGLAGGLCTASYVLSVQHDVLLNPAQLGGAHQCCLSLEALKLPPDVAGNVQASEEWAARGVVAVTQHLAPGYDSHVRISLVNHSPGMVRIYAGTPVARVTFEEVYDRRAVVNRFYVGRDKVYDTRTMADNETITELGT